jgi:hypothetical protein
VVRICGTDNLLAFEAERPAERACIEAFNWMQNQAVRAICLTLVLGLVVAAGMAWLAITGGGRGAAAPPQQRRNTMANEGRDSVSQRKQANSHGTNGETPRRKEGAMKAVIAKPKVCVFTETVFRPAKRKGGDSNGK